VCFFFFFKKIYEKKERGTKNVNGPVIQKGEKKQN